MMYASPRMADGELRPKAFNPPRVAYKGVWHLLVGKKLPLDAESAMGVTKG